MTTEFKKTTRIREEEHSIGVTIDVAVQTPSAIASCDYMHDGGSWMVTRVWVPEIYRGQGNGSALLTQLKITASKKKGFKRLIVTPGGYGSDPALLNRFYEKNGFVLSKEADEDGLYEWKSRGVRVPGPTTTVVAAEVIMDHPNLSLDPKDYIEPKK